MTPPPRTILPRLAALLALLLLPPLTGCGILGKRPVAVERPILESQSGLRVRERLVGRGEPAREGDRVRIDYVARLEDGSLVASTYASGRPEDFVLGEHPLRGIDEGVAGMRLGGRRELRLPPELAYGAEGAGELVPPDATLVLEVELRALEPAPR